MATIIETLKELNIYSTVFRIFLAVILGGIIGLERGHHGRAAGLRTHILVCLGAAMSAIIGVYSVKVLELGGDPMRIAAQVVSGIGFLGVGTIMIRNGEHVTGLTTAAGLWATAAIGLALGIGFYIAALLAFIFVIITMVIFVKLEISVKNKSFYICYLEITDIRSVNEIYEELKPLASSIDIIPPKSGIASNIGLELKADSPERYEELLSRSRENESIAIALPLQN